MLPNHQFLEIPPYDLGKESKEIEQEYGLPYIVRLASNENPYGFSQHINATLMKELQYLNLYPESKANSVREVLADFLNVKMNNLILGNGTDEILSMICRIFLSENTNTIMSSLTFPQYKRKALLQKCEVREASHIEGKHNLEAMLELVDDKTKVIWLCNPNNPTGEYFTHAHLVYLLENIGPHVLVVCDEAYYEYVEAKDFPDSLSLLPKYPNLMVTRTFSKAYGLAALRLGYGIANKELITILESDRETFNTSRLAQVAAISALEDQTFIQQCRKKNRKELEHFYTFCWKNNISFYPSQANFIYLTLQRDSTQVSEKLLTKGFMIRANHVNGLRITLGTSQQNDDLMAYLAQELI